MTTFVIVSRIEQILFHIELSNKISENLKIYKIQQKFKFFLLFHLFYFFVFN